MGSLPLAPPGKPRHLRLLDKLTKHPLSGKCCGEDFLPTMECGLNPDVLEFSCVDLDEFGGEPRPFFQDVFPMSFFFFFPHKAFSNSPEDGPSVFECPRAFSISFCLDILPHYSSSPLLEWTPPEGRADLSSAVCLLLVLVQEAPSRRWSQVV